MEEDAFIRHVKEQLDAGIPKQEIVENLSKRTLLKPAEAERFVDVVDNLRRSDPFERLKKIGRFFGFRQTDANGLVQGKKRRVIRELFDLIVSAIILAIAFGIALSGGIGAFSNSQELVTAVLISLVAVSSGFVFHELGHRFVARRYGFSATYAMWLPGLIIAFACSFFGFIFAAPGAVKINHGVDGNELTTTYKNKLGKIALAGPLMNLCLAVIFFMLIIVGIIGNLSNTLLNTFSMGTDINLWLAFFNLIPIGALDGWKVFKWNKIVWLIVTLIPASVMIFPNVFF